MLLEDQDRSLWDRELIAEGTALVERALAARRFGPYTLQAAIAAVHADGAEPRRDRLGPDRRPVRLLLQAAPSPVVELNRAVAVAMRDGPAPGWRSSMRILARGDLLTITWRTPRAADLCRRLGRTAEARAAYERALAWPSRRRSAVILRSG